ncbi:manganese efflux pump MntP family protein [Clostridium sp. Ade.TY]|uniref:manganese efflux pump MntP n=1 Tax=Clostridium sp. Ade.TY TaxID=1391647 RepID=UPI000405C9CF|nr:manganese efflux pump MntP family protein [Clostridium sp. Ade.TY]
MSIFSIILMGVGLAMDAFAVSLAKGMTIKNDLKKKAIKIALYFGIFQGVMPFIGWFCGRYFTEYIGAFGDIIAFILLVVIGGKMIFEFFKGLKDENLKTASEEVSDEINIDDNKDICSDELSTKSIVILAIATSIDALAVGVSFAFLNVNILVSISIIAIVTFIICLFGVILGKKLGFIFSKYAELLGGAILVIIGFKILM